MRQPFFSAASACLKTIATLAMTIALGTPAHAHPNHESTKLAGCTPIDASHPMRQRIEADVADFVRAVPEAAAMRFEVQDCNMDGQLYNGKAIVLSARLARLIQPQRLFIIAHEWGHYMLGHQAQLGSLLARIAAGRRDETTSTPAVTEHAHRTEFEADAFAVRLMHAQGRDPEEAARLFDSLGAGRDNATHPAFSRRAQAIRDVRAALMQAPTATAQSAP